MPVGEVDPGSQSACAWVSWTMVSAKAPLNSLKQDGSVPRGWDVNWSKTKSSGGGWGSLCLSPSKIR